MTMFLDDEEEQGSGADAGFTSRLVDGLGLRLMREGEMQLPSTNRTSRTREYPEPDRRSVTYHFPVEVEVRGGLSEEDQLALERRIFGALSAALERLG